MEGNGKEYEAPSVRVFRFDDNDLILTSSGSSTDSTEESTTPTEPPADYASNALNALMGGINTTMER